MNQELTQSAANYIIDLNNNINQFNILAGNYCNVIVTAKFYHDFNQRNKEETNKMVKDIDENERATILNTVQQARFFAVQTYLRITALKEEIKQFQTNYEELKKYYKIIINEPVPNFEDIQNYALQLNAMFSSVAAQDLLTKSSEYYEQIASANVNE